MNLPQIVYLQTTTACNGHCRYCPFDDVYGDDVDKMSFRAFTRIIKWLKDNQFAGRVGFLLHYEPTMDDRLEKFVKHARAKLPGVSLEVATNGIIKSEALDMFDVVDCVPAGTNTHCTSRAGNCKATPETVSRGTLRNHPCPIPIETMCIAANGDVLLCCQDWRHEAVVGTVDDLSAAREYQLSLVEKVHDMSLEICCDCMTGRTAEEVGERLGKRFINQKETDEDSRHG